MCVIPCAASQSASSKRSRVVVEKRRTSCVTLVLTVNRAHATTESLCTSRPAHRRCNVFIMHLHSRCRRHEAFVLEIYPTCSQLTADLGSTITGRLIRVLKRLPVK